MNTGVIKLTMKQAERYAILRKAEARFITVREAAEKLGISQRQVQRLKKEVRDNGAAALVHKNTLRKPAHALSEEMEAKILKVRKQAGYRDSNFNHFKELLEVNFNIIISYSALYRLLKDDGIKSPMTRRRFKPHRRRKRRPDAGSLVQIDASPFDWLNIGQDLELHGGIDDATGQVTGLYLCQNECMLGYYEAIRRMIGIFGVPEAVYADRHTIFRSPNADKRERLDTPNSVSVNDTQLGRAMRELGVQIIAARSPQAKGRIERLWGTLQSRLPVEFALKGIKDIAAANEFLAAYIFAYNSEFAVEPQERDSSFLSLDERLNLDHVLCIKEERVIDHGHVFSYKGTRLQIVDCDYASLIPNKARVTVMISPRIGVKAAYKTIVFDTIPAPIKAKASASNAQAAPVTTEATATPHSTESSDSAPKRDPFIPKDGLLWKPGLESYQEVMEILQDVFMKPYATRSP
jgi:transposase